MGIFHLIVSLALTIAGLAKLAAPPAANPVKTERRLIEPFFDIFILSSGYY
nr:hypothetical protein [uncultured Cohaesibacter sp.]